MEEQKIGGTAEGGLKNEEGVSFSSVGTTGKSALICEADHALRDVIAQNLKDLHYSTTFSESAKEAIEAMSFHVFDVVVLDELFGTENSGNNALLAYLSKQNMSMRRRFFVALVGKNYNTADKMAAFNKSVNMVVNTGDIDLLGEAVRRGVDDHNAFYHVFFETLHKTGKI